MSRRRIGQIALGMLFVVAGLNHYWDPDFYLRMMPGYLPWHPQLVATSGTAEVLGGVLLVLGRAPVVARWWLIALLVAVFPANLEMAFHPTRFPDLPTWALWLRLPFQAVFIWWVWIATRPDMESA